MNKDIKKLNDLGDEFFEGKIKTNEINKKFTEFYELYKKVLIEQFKNSKSFKLIEIEKEYLYISGYFKFNSKTYFFMNVNLINFKFSKNKNNIGIKEVNKEIDYINKEITIFKDFSFYDLKDKFINLK